MITPLRHAVVSFAAATLAACTAMTPASDPSRLPGTAWVLATLPGHTLLAGGLPTARFDEDRVSGTDGCNRYNAPYTASGSTLQVGPRGASTQMACPPEVMGQAQAFMNALTAARGYDRAGSELRLLAGDGSVLATFAAQPQSLPGTSWRVTAYNNGKQAVASVLTGTDLTLAFAGDGRVSGSAGCNTFNARYTLDGRKLAFGPAAATRKLCATPDGVMLQEQQFLQALETVATARFEGDRLELRTAADALAMLLTKAPR